MGLDIKIINKSLHVEPVIFEKSDFLNYKETMTYLGYFNLIKSYYRNIKIIMI